MPDEMGPTEAGEIDRATCIALLSTQRVGRLVVGTGVASEPDVVPVNYIVADGNVVFRTSDTARAVRQRSQRVTFEVDAIDYARRAGWSVIVHGRMADVTNDPTIDSEHRERLTTWAPGDRGRWLSIDIDDVTGRWVLTTEEGPGHEGGGYL